MYSKLVLFLIMSAQVFSGILEPTADPKIITFYEALGLAKANNFDLKKSEQKTLIKEGEARAAQSLLLPQLSYNLSKSLGFKDEAFDVNSSSLKLVVPFFDGKKLFEAKAKHEQMLAAKEKNRFEIDSMINKVGMLYIEALLLEAGKDIAKEQWEQNQQQLLVLEKKANAGLARNLDVSRSRYLSSKAESDFLLKEQSYLEKIGELGEQLGKNKQFSLRMIEIASPYLEKDKKVLVAMADENSEAKALRRELAALDQSLTGEGFDFLPKLSMSADVSNDRWLPFSSGSSFKILLNLELPLFSGGQSLASIKIKRANRAIGEIDLRQKAALRPFHINSLLEQIRRFVLIKNNTKEALKAAIEARDSAERMFEEGEATSLEVIEANTNLFSAKTQSVTNDLELEKLKLKLLFTVGKLSDLCP